MHFGNPNAARKVSSKLRALKNVGAGGTLNAVEESALQKLLEDIIQGFAVHLTIPEGVHYIAPNILKDLKYLASITLLNVNPPQIELDSIPTTCNLIRVPAEALEAYKSATNWINYRFIIRPISND